MSRKANIPETQPPPVPLWMVTFSDTTGLLVCFFVMIIGFSAMEKEDREGAPGSLVGFPNAGINNDSLVSVSDAVAGQIQTSGYETSPDYDPLSYVRERLEYHAKATAVMNAFQPRLTEQGFEINIQPGEIFERDSAVLMPGANRILDILAECTRDIPHLMRIEAFADDLFVASEEFRSPEELATRRSAVVCRYLQMRGKVSAGRLMAAAGMAELGQHPAQARGQVTVTVLPAPKRKIL